MTNPSLPQELMEVLQWLRPVFHACSWESFLYLVTGLLLGQAQAGVVRASLVAPKGYNWRRLSDLLRRNAWSGTGLMVALTSMVLATLYPDGFPTHLFWVVDPTYLEKMYAKAIEDVMSHRRPHPKPGQGRNLQGHEVVLVAHLYRQSIHRLKAFLLGGLLYVKQATFVELSGELVNSLPLPVGVHNVLVTDRGLTSLKLAKTLLKQEVYSLGRVKANANFYLPATEKDYKGRGRRPTYGDKFRADAAPKHAMQQVEMSVPVDGKLKPGIVSRGTFLRKGFSHPVDLIRVEVKGLAPWLLMLTDPTLSTEEAVYAYYGRSQIEVAIAQAKALGLDQYRGRRQAGIQRWPMIIGVVHSLLQLIAVGALKLTLPAQNWPWYRKETTVGSIQRRLFQLIQRVHFLDLFRRKQKDGKMDKAA